MSKEKLQQLRQQSDDGSETAKSSISVKLSHSEPRVRQVEAEPTQVFPEKKGELYPASATPVKPARTNPPQKSLSVTTTSKSRAPLVPQGQSGASSQGQGQGITTTPHLPKSGGAINKGRAPQPPQSSVASKSSDTATAAKIQGASAAKTPANSGATPSAPSSGKSTPRIRSGCINARASFWEKRIQGEETKEEEFPDMIEHVNE